jgi:hypothetical protein
MSSVKTLIKKKRVCRHWRQMGTKVIEAKRTSSTRKVLTTNQELCDAVGRYCEAKDPDAVEKIAATYGWPINKWDVSNLQDFSNVFVYY